MLNKRVRFILMGLVAASAFSFAAVSCMNYMGKKSANYIDMKTLELVQKETPENDDPVAVIKTSMGDIKAVLYPEYAPKAVESFTKLAEEGYYDNTYVFQSEPGVYFGAGSAEKNGDLGYKYNEASESVEQELNQNLWPFKGALCSMVTGQEGGFFKKLFGNSKTLNGSRFAVLNSVEFTEDFKKELLDTNKDDTTVADAFIELGGVPNLSQQITVFGQTYEGFDVIDKLTDLEVVQDEDEIKIPVDDVMIETIEISTYGEEQD